MAAPQVEAKGKRESRIGKRPIVLPKGVTVSIKDRKVEVKGQKGTLSMDLPLTVSVREASGQLAVESSDQGPDGPRLQELLDPEGTFEPVVHEGFEFWVPDAENATPEVTRWVNSISVATLFARGITSPLHVGQWLPHPAPDPDART